LWQKPTYWAGDAAEIHLLGWRCSRNPLIGLEMQMKALIGLLKDESGATAIEYGLIAAGIAVAIIAVVGTVGTQLNVTFTSVSSSLK
jgi:pilus assembly protein Flp/PilA